MMDRDVWLMSNRQPFVHAIINMGLRTKTRKGFAIRSGDVVFLHASQSLWDGWSYLSWAKDLDVHLLPRGGVYGVASVKAVGKTFDVMPESDFWFFRIPFHVGHCANVMAVVFDRVVPLPFVACKGSLQPTRKLPMEIKNAIEYMPEYRQALECLTG